MEGNERWKQRQAERIGVLLAGVGIALLAVGIGILLAAVPASGQETLVAAECKQAERIEYLRCGHTVMRRTDVRPSFVGMTRQRLEEALEQEGGVWRLTSFSPEKISVTKQLDIYCPAHFVLMMDEDEHTAVFRNLDGETMERIAACDVPAGDDTVRAQLRRGMAFDSLAELEAAAEAMRAQP
ncbi:MAG TPA: hypothetical protein IAC36_05750 [Candidatus Aphodomonas merdavium]|nr:hypothetical protein [Candidatus Aphodomonas merdavium]